MKENLNTTLKGLQQVKDINFLAQCMIGGEIFE
jgi:hypothetical protein